MVLIRLKNADKGCFGYWKPFVYNLRATSISVKMCFIIVLKMTAYLNKGFHLMC